MIEWNLFYKMLDIPEELTEPTFYDLLGLQAETCGAERVDHMLHIQKKRLRQNLPSPQFIPLILSFEKRILDRAAAVLRDPKTREKYNKYLLQQANQRKGEGQEERLRLRLVRQSRGIINSLLNPDKTLGDSERPILAAKLRELGIAEISINSLIKKIPRPTSAAAKRGDEVKEGLVAARSKFLHREERSDSAESIRSEDLAGSVLTEQPPSETEQFVPMPRWIRRHQSALLIAMGIMVLGGFVFAIWFFKMDGRETLPQWGSWTAETSLAAGHRENREGQKISHMATKPEGNPSKDEGAPTDMMAPQPGHKRAGQTEEQQERRSTSSTGQSTPIANRLLVRAEDVRNAYSNSTRTEELLADLAMTMLACSCRATQYTLGSTDCYDALRVQMNEPDRSSFLTRAVTIVPMMSVANATKSALANPAQSESKTTGRRSKSSQSTSDPIERLRREDTPEAADELVQSLVKRSLQSSGRIDMVCRILRSLSTMTDSSIPQRLINLLPRSSPEVAFQITRTLAKASGSTTSDGRFRGGRLPLANTLGQRQRYARWWTRHSPAWGRAQSIGSMPSFWEPDATAIKLLAMTAHYAEMTGEVLKNYPLEAGAPVQAERLTTNAMGVTCLASGVGTRLLDSLNGIYAELSRIITLHPDHTKTASLRDAIRLHKKEPRAAACENQLQEIVVTLDAIADLLIVLLRQADPNDELKESLATLEEERDRACSQAFNVVYELRESCYYNLVLWDTLIEHTISSSILAQTSMPVRSNRR